MFKDGDMITVQARVTYVGEVSPHDGCYTIQIECGNELLCRDDTILSEPMDIIRSTADCNGRRIANDIDDKKVLFLNGVKVG